MAHVLVFMSRGRLFGIDIGSVGEILPLREVLEIPSASPLVRGAVNVRGRVLPLFDFRSLIGGQTLLEERRDLASTLAQREQEHVEWLETLTESVKKGTEFRKALDPRACPFGKWYYGYKAPDSTIERLLHQFEKPHADIHALGNTALAQARNGDIPGAMSEIEKARTTTLSSLIRLFAQLRETLVTELRNMFLLLKTPEGVDYALCIDGVETVRNLARENLTRQEPTKLSTLIKAVWSNTETNICEVNVAALHAVVTGNCDIVTEQSVFEAVLK